jgi:hypothetical protein
VAFCDGFQLASLVLGGLLRRTDAQIERDTPVLVLHYVWGRPALIVRMNFK